MKPIKTQTGHKLFTETVCNDANLARLCFQQSPNTYYLTFVIREKFRK